MEMKDRLFLFRLERISNPSVWYSPYDLASENESRRALSRYVDAQKEVLDEDCSHGVLVAKGLDAIMKKML